VIEIVLILPQRAQRLYAELAKQSYFVIFANDLCALCGKNKAHGYTGLWQKAVPACDAPWLIWAHEENRGTAFCDIEKSRIGSNDRNR